MDIVFNALKTNLGDTGGCLSILESADVLKTMDHNVSIVATVNRMKQRTYETVSHIPPADICIGISVLDIDSTLHAKADKKVIWLRGPEWKWLMDKKKMLEKLHHFIKHGGKVLCNSEWLTEWMIRHNIPSKTCYVGLDFNIWEDRNERRAPAVGTLYSKRNSKKFESHFFRQLRFYLDNLKINYYTLGTFHKLHNQEQALTIYNCCTVWFAPSILEGFHRVPAEAALCGCLVVAIDNIRGGTADWLIHNETGYRYKNVEHAIKLIKELPNDERIRMVANAKRKLEEKIGTKERCMRKLIEVIND